MKKQGINARTNCKKIGSQHLLFCGQTKCLRGLKVSFPLTQRVDIDAAKLVSKVTDY